MGIGWPSTTRYVKESASVPTHFAKLFGIDSISVKVRATACGLCSSVPQGAPADPRPCS